MTDLSTLAFANLLSPMVLCFVLGALAAWLRSDLDMPEAMVRGMSLYLMLAIGFKGGVAMAGNASMAALLAVLAAAGLIFLLPFVAFPLLRVAAGLSRVDAGALRFGRRDHLRHRGRIPARN